MKEFLTRQEYDRLDDEIKPYFEQKFQYKDGYLPEWKDTIVVGFHQDRDHPTRTVFKLKDPLPSTTGSDFGSYHWFMTLMARHKHTGEFLKYKTPDEDVLRQWGRDLFETSNYIIAWFKLFEKANK